MTDAAQDAPEQDDAPRKKGKGPMIIGLVLMLAGAGGGYFAVNAGLLPFGHAPAPEEDGHESSAEEMPEPLPDVAYVELEPVVVTLMEGGAVQYLRFLGSLETAAEHREEVELLLPRVIDVMNGYLRALRVSDFEDPMALTKLRAQLLRRIQVVTGKGRVRDLLVMDYVLN